MNEPVAGPIVNEMLTDEYDAKKKALNNEVSSSNLSKEQIEAIKKGSVADWVDGWNILCGVHAIRW